ncbi:MAG: hypothetical protein LBE34_00380 [Flavobacteriaceae bacterium]|jgi:hypothetical protein|nr:hypothetical protein [Flavobacteriaceae bacterium]
MNPIIERAKAPTPKFFKTLRTVGLSLLAVSGGILAAPIALPAALTTLATYLAVAGGIASAISQITVETSPSSSKELPDEEH